MQMKSFLALICGTIFAQVAFGAMVDFEDLSVGDSGLTLSSGDANFSVSGQGNAGTNSGGIASVVGTRELMIFDADCSGGPAGNCSGGDTDLYFPGVGNILIISEDNDGNDPDDSRFGGDVLVDFNDNIVSIVSLVLDADEDITVTAFLNGATVGGPEVISTGNGGAAMTSFTINTEADQLLFHFNGSGAIGSIDYTVVPIPAAAWLFATGLISFYGLGRRTYTSQVYT